MLVVIEPGVAPWHAVAMTARSAVRWAATHGAMRLAIRNRARKGNPDAEVLLDPAVRVDPYEHYERLRTRRPFVGGAFARTSVHHDVCTDVLRSDDFGVVAPARVEGLPPALQFALRLAGPRPSIGPVDPPSMLAVDPPEHTRYRHLVSRAFSARAVMRLRERTAEIADELLDGLEREGRAADGRVDLVARYASLLPVTVISEVLGVPTDMREQFLAWGDGATPSLDMGVDWRTHRSVERNLAELDAWFRTHLEQLRREPGDSLLSALVTAADRDEAGLTDEELLATALLVFGAGFETTVNLIANGAGQLFEHPDQRQLLVDDPSLWPNAVEEVLRVDSPVQRTGRRAVRNTVVHDVPIREGDLVILVLAAANRDPRVFDDPHTFDVRRANARDHVAFSGGIHFCLGAALARMEGEIALRALSERFPDLAPAGSPRRRGTVILRGYDSMPVRLGPTATAARSPGEGTVRLAP